MQNRAYEFYGDIPIDQESYYSFFDSNFFITYTMEYYSKLRDEDKKRGNNNG